MFHCKFKKVEIYLCVHFIICLLCLRLKYSRRRRFLVSKLLDVWLKRSNEEQCVLIEAVEQLTVSAELSTAALTAAKTAAEKMKAKSAFSRVHILIMVRQKFLTLYSR